MAIIRVKKKNGRLQKFSAEKIIMGCVRAGSTKKLAKQIASRVRKRAYDRISTLAIKRMVVKLLGKKLRESYRKFRKKSGSRRYRT